MKKIIFIGIFVCLFFVSLASVSALRLGLEFGSPNAVVIIRPEPFDIKIGYNVSEIFGQGAGTFFHVSLDYRIIDSYQLVDFLHLFLSVGGYAQIYTESENDSSFNLGARIPIGLQAFLLKNTLEVFFEVVPTVLFIPTIDFGGLQGFIGFTVKLPK